MTNPLPPWLTWLEACPSTNTWAIEHLAHLDHGTVVFTRHQTHGRGQQGRVWHSLPGVLTLSVVLNQLPAAQLPQFSLIAGLAVIYAIEDLVPALQKQLRLKWTNDIWLHERKLAGILCEGVTSGVGNGTKLVIGIGLNYDAKVSDLDIQSAKSPISLHEVVLVIPDEYLLIEKLRFYLLQLSGLMQSLSHSSRLSDLLSVVQERDALLGKFITIETSGETISGDAIGIDDHGCLRLRLADGTIRTFMSGHVAVVQ